MEAGPRQRRSSRVRYPGRVRLTRGHGRPGDGSWDDVWIETRAFDLSEGGVGLMAFETLPVGEPVTCQLELEGDEVALRGAVAWADREPRPDTARLVALGQSRPPPHDPEPSPAPLSMGIAFEPPEVQTCTLLRAALASHEPVRSAVDLEFKGQTAPIRSRAESIPGGLRVRAPLPIFQPGHDLQVRFATPDAEAVDAWIQHVRLDQSGEVPALLVDIALANTRTAETLVGFDAHDRTGPDGASADSAGVEDLRLDASTANDDHPNTGFEAFASDADPRDELDGAGGRAGSRPPRPSLVEREALTGRRRRRRGTIITGLAGAAMGAAAAYGAMVMRPPATPSDVTTSMSAATAPAEPPAPPSQGEGDSDNDPAGAKSGAAPARTPRAAAALTSDATAASPPEAKTDKAQARATQAKEALPTKPQVELIADGTVTRVRVPLAGDTGEWRSYALSTPGMVVELPRARTPLKLERYGLYEGLVKHAWLRKRGTALQVRLTFVSRAVRYEAKVEPNQVTIDLRR